MTWEGSGMGLDMMYYRATHDAEDEQIGYQRKANAVHGWIIRNLAEGRDDSCARIALPPEALREMIADIDRALSDPASADNPMPPTPGFFFGSLELDEWYTNDLLEARQLALHMLDQPDEQFYYVGWW